MGDITGLLFPLAIMAVFFFFIIRPQQKKQKNQKAFSANLKKGDEVVTNSGLIGKISKVEDNVITLQVGQKTFLRFLRGTISKEMTEVLPKIQTGEVIDTGIYDFTRLDFG